MQTVLAIFWHVILALVGALGFAALVVAGAALCCGGAAFGCACIWRGLKRKGR